MSVIFLLIGCSFLLSTLFLVSFLVASKAEQFDDDYTPSVRILFDDEEEKTSDESHSEK